MIHSMFAIVISTIVVLVYSASAIEKLKTQTWGESYGP